MSRYIQKTEFTCIVTYPTDKHPLKGRGLDMGLLKKAKRRHGDNQSACRPARAGPRYPLRGRPSGRGFGYGATKKEPSKSLTLFQQPRAESNCYLKFRKLPFYPLNYRAIVRKESRLLSLLLDDLTTSVVAALWAYSVVHDSCTAV